MIAKRLQTLMKMLSELESYIPHAEKSNPAVSKSTVGWQIEHGLLVIDQIIESLKRSQPSQFKRKFHLIREAVLLFNKIPRGKGRAPKSTLPTTGGGIDQLKQMAAHARIKISELIDIPQSHYFTHPYFGDLNYSRTIKFINLHTAHHLQIIRDIVKSA